MDTTIDKKILHNGSPRARAIRMLRDWIEQGRLQPGMPLPPERELSQHMGVGLATVQRALRVLTNEGLIQQRDGHTRLLSSSTSTTVSSIIRQTLLVLAPAEVPFAGHSQAGWAEYIGIGATAAARQSGKGVLCLPPEKLLEQTADRLLSVRPSCVLVSDMSAMQRQSLDEYLAVLAKDGVPIVVYGNGPLDQPYDRVASDHETGAYLLTRHLIDRGSRRILPIFTMPEDVYWKKGRQEGYNRAMRESGLEPLDTLWKDNLQNSFTAEHFRVQSNYLAGRLVPYLTGGKPVDAIMAASDGEVFSIAAACRLFGREPQKDILLAGYDNYYGECPERDVESSVPIATVDKQNFVLGGEMMALLQDRIAGNLAEGPQLRLIPPRLITR